MFSLLGLFESLGLLYWIKLIYNLKYDSICIKYSSKLVFFIELNPFIRGTTVYFATQNGFKKGNIPPTPTVKCNIYIGPC